MSDTNKKVEISKTDDARRVEKHVEEFVNGGTTERVTTILEEKVPMETKRTIKETIVPVVTTRKICEYQNGQLVNEAVEMVQDTTIKSVGGKATITRDDLDSLIQKAVANAMAKVAPVQQAPVSMVEEMPAIVPPAPTRTARTMLAEKYQETPSAGTDSVNVFNYFLYAALAALAAAVVYFAIIKPLI